MFEFLKKKKSEEELYLEDLNRRKQAQDLCSSSSSITFELKVEDVFSISGRGTVVTGRIARGKIAQGDRVIIRGREGRVLEAEIGGIESFRKALRTAFQGEAVGLLLRGIQKDQVHPGDILTGI